MKDLMKLQLELEAEMHGSGILRFTKNNQRSIDSGAASEADWFRRLTREFVKPMAEAITAYKDYYATRRGKPSACLQHLACISPEAAAYISIKTIMDSLTGSKIPAQALANNIGKRIEDEIRFTKLDNAAPEYIGAIKDSLKKRANKSYKFEHDALVHAEKEIKLLSNFQALHEGEVSKIETKRLLDIDEDKYKALLEKVEYAIDFDRWIPWPQNDILQLGAKMIDVFANNMLMDGNALIEKVNVSTGNSKNRATPAAIVPTEHLEKWIEEYKQVMGGLSPAYEPCVVPPRDWRSPFNGGYHSKEVSNRLNMVKVRNKKHLKRLSYAQMPEVYDSINGLQRVGWQVHQFILETANEIRLKGLPLGMPQMDQLERPACPVPVIYEELRGAELLACLDDDQKGAFVKWKRDTVSYYAAEQKRRGDVREAIATIDQGIKFKDFSEIFFVYTLDFRSRVYSQGSLLSPQGGDLQKALIRFSEGLELGDTGEYWLKVHGANVWGWDKEEFDERVSRCETSEFKDMCLDIAADPISFTQWTNADKPWQFLAWCYEYAALLDHVEEGNEASTFISHAAVAMDGSCSGIQHYSAMLRDEIGGKEVNLVPSDKPQDIYRAVSDHVNNWMDAIVSGYTQDVPVWDKIEEKIGKVKAYQMSEEWLNIGVNRSMTKKPVMTLPYGSSQLTCRDSISDYLRDLQEKAERKELAGGMLAGKVHNFTDKSGKMPLQEAISLASMMTWKGISEVVVAAKAGMKYIKAVTAVVSTLGSSLEWVTPTGFIVEQSIFEVSEDKQVFTNMLGGCKFRVKEDTNKIDARRMGSSCAPNFVHSMDASHLIRATNYYLRNGIKSIAVIHDSFGTHACNTQKARGLLNGSFVDMYVENDVIADFKTYNEERLMTEIDVELPERGSLDLEQVRNSPYLFG